MYDLTCKLLSFDKSLSFNTESEQGVAQAILRGAIDFKREPWPSMSECAKTLVQQMLEPDPKLRLTAKQVLGKLGLTYGDYVKSCLPTGHRF